MMIWNVLRMSITRLFFGGKGRVFIRGSPIDISGSLNGLGLICVFAAAHVYIQFNPEKIMTIENVLPEDYAEMLKV